MSARQRLVVGGCVVAAVLAVVLGLSATSGTSAASCGRPCGATSASVATSSSGAKPIACIRDVGCSGGFVLGSANGLAVVALAPLALAFVLPSVRRRRRFSITGLLGRIPATGLFRPPRPLLGV